MKLSALRSRRAAAALALAALVVLARRGGLDAKGLLVLAPALLIACSLLAPRYPGQTLLVALAAPSHVHRSRTRQRSARLPVGACQMPRGPLLMGRSLAVRPPPGASAAA
ncbi:MAG TPA: hypothetical protein VKG82_00735 [Solirubrobacteraceae bacterium]|nr:hypothetical protein [Solirubrobacteraceae bacterium]